MCTPGDHEATKANPARWAALPLVGVQLVEADETGPADRLELRDCHCGSTLARSVGESAPGATGSAADPAITSPDTLAGHK